MNTLIQQLNHKAEQAGDNTPQYFLSNGKLIIAQNKFSAMVDHILTEMNEKYMEELYKKSLAEGADVDGALHIIESFMSNFDFEKLEVKK